MAGKALGRHVILELYGCPRQLLENEKLLKQLLAESSERAGATLLKLASHHFQPQGVTVVGLLAESHISIHTWPERRYAAVDVFTCGQTTRPEKAAEYLTQHLRPTASELKILERGDRQLAHTAPARLCASAGA
ncbi:MAG: hypothetical protein Kow00109_18860 [Acidobacteriota bacterium]